MENIYTTLDVRGPTELRLKGYTAEEMAAELNKIRRVPERDDKKAGVKLLGFKATSDYVARVELDDSYNKGTHINRGGSWSKWNTSRYVVPCSRFAVHAAKHPCHPFIKHGWGCTGVFYIVEMVAVVNVHDKWAGRRYKVVGRVATEDAALVNMGSYDFHRLRWSTLKS